MPHRSGGWRDAGIGNGTGGGSRACSLGLWVSNFVFWMSNPGFEFWSLRFELRGLEVGLKGRNLGFGVWGLGFGVGQEAGGAQGS